MEATHGGLECGLLMEKIPGLDAVSMGPELHDVPVRERLSVPPRSAPMNWYASCCGAAVECDRKLRGGALPRLCYFAGFPSRKCTYCGAFLHKTI